MILSWKKEVERGAAMRSQWLTQSKLKPYFTRIFSPMDFQRFQADFLHHWDGGLRKVFLLWHAGHPHHLPHLSSQGTSLVSLVKRIQSMHYSRPPWNYLKNTKTNHYQQIYASNCPAPLPGQRGAGELGGDNYLPRFCLWQLRLRASGGRAGW